MKTIPIGDVTITYNNGRPQDVRFKPDLGVCLDRALQRQLLDIGPSRDPEKIRSNADLVLASWFSQLSGIELASREHYAVSGQIKECWKDEAGEVVKITIAYSFRQLLPDVEAIT